MKASKIIMTLLSVAILSPATTCAQYIERHRSVLDPVYLYQAPCFKVRLVARLNLATFYSYDGRDNDLFFVTNDNMPSYLGLRLRYNVSNDITVGNDYELGLRVNRSNRVSQTDDRRRMDIDIRKLDFFVESATFGRLSLGQGRTASDRTSKIDLSGTRVVAASNVAKIGGGLFFRSEYADLVSDSDNPTVRESYNNINGLRRRTRLRYDTPYWHGFSLATSAAENRRYDLALRYKYSSDCVQALAAVAYARSYTPLPTGPGTDDWEECMRRILRCHRQASYNGSASVLINHGFSVTVAGGYLKPQEQPRHIATFGYGKLGYITRCNCWGETAFSIDYGQYHHFSGNHHIGNSYGVAAVQHVALWNTYIYAGYRLFALRAPNQDFHNINVVTTGIFTRI